MAVLAPLLLFPAVVTTVLTLRASVPEALGLPGSPPEQVVAYVGPMPSVPLAGPSVPDDIAVGGSGLVEDAGKAPAAGGVAFDPERSVQALSATDPASDLSLVDLKAPPVAASEEPIAGTSVEAEAGTEPVRADLRRPARLPPPPPPPGGLLFAAEKAVPSPVVPVRDAIANDPLPANPMVTKLPLPDPLNAREGLEPSYCHGQC